MDIRHPARVAVLIALGITAPSCAHSDASATPVLTTRLALRDDLRQLWTSSASWTRVLIVSSAAGLPDSPAATARLMRNAADLGDAIRPFHGDLAAYRLTALLTDHVTGTTEVIAATLAADNAALETARAYWYANAEELALFLATLSPEWDHEMLRALLRAQLDEIMAETMARVSGDAEGDIAAHDGAVAQAREIADVMADGIAQQFPDLVSPRTFLSAPEQALHVSMRELWQDHAEWTRFLLVDTLASLPSARATEARLAMAESDLGGAIAQYEGAPAADRLMLLLRLRSETVQELALAFALGDADGAGLAEASLHANARELAELFSGLSPDGSTAGFAELTTELADHTTEQALARVREDHEADVDAADGALAASLRLGDMAASQIARDAGAALPTGS